MVFRKNPSIYLISKKSKKNKGNHGAGCNHGRSVQQLATDSCKLPPVDPVAPSSDIDDPRIINAVLNPNPKVNERKIYLNLGFLLLALQATPNLKGKPFPSPLPLMKTSGGTLGTVRNGCK
jgi:hypothetical protein